MANTSDPPGPVPATPRQLCRMFEYAVQGVAVYAPDGTILDCNPAFANMVGRSLQELQQLAPHAFIHPEDRERARGDLERLVAGDTPAFVIEKRYVRPDESLVWARNSVSLIWDEQHQPLYSVAISEDQTHLRLAERALIQNEKLASIGRLSASIAHELNNPLEAVVNLLFLIAQSESIADVRNFAHLAEQEMARVAQISTQTLRFYRQQSAPAPLHLDEILDSVIALFEGRLRHRKVRLFKRYTVCDHAPSAYGGELRQVFLNLVGNAIDAMEKEGTLRIGVRPSRCWGGAGTSGVRVTICDTGGGIPRHMLKKVFEPFVSTKEEHGTGLGLWISRDIIRRHGGTLRVRSATTGPRRGTAMSVFLPSADSKSATRAA